MNKLFYLFALMLAQVIAIAQIPATFSPYTLLPTNGGVSQIKIVDMNNDGRNDQVVYSLKRIGGPPGEVKIYYQDSLGQYGALQVVYYNDWVDPTALEIGDIDGDGRLDIVMDSWTYLVAIKQKTLGVFTSEQIQPGIWPGMITEIGTLAVGDLNNDGKDDIASIWGDPFWQVYRIQVFYQSSSGQLTSVLYTPAAWAGVMKIADINGDGRNDLVTQAGGYFCSYPQRLDSSLGTPITSFLPYGSTKFALGDINGDSKIDMVVSVTRNIPDARLYIYLQENGVLTLKDTVPTYEMPSDIEIAKINSCNSLNDIIVRSWGWNKVIVHTNSITKPGTFGGYNLFSTPNSNYLAVGDINNDGKKDIVVAAIPSGLALLRNTSTSSPVSQVENTVVGVSSTLDTVLKTRRVRWGWNFVLKRPPYVITTRDSTYEIVRTVTERRCEHIRSITTTRSCTATVRDTSFATVCTNNFLYDEWSTSREVSVDTLLVPIQGCGILVYPNPTATIVIVVGNSPLGDLELYAADGKIVKRYSTKAQELWMNLTEFPEGVYFLKTKWCTNRILKIH